eukprot:11160653-Lingulodinium_polyedra.AAC.1
MCFGTALELLGNCLGTARELLGNYLGGTWELPRNCLGTAWGLLPPHRKLNAAHGRQLTPQT